MVPLNKKYILLGIIGIAIFIPMYATACFGGCTDTVPPKLQVVSEGAIISPIEHYWFEEFLLDISLNNSIKSNLEAMATLNIADQTITVTNDGCFDENDLEIICPDILLQQQIDSLNCTESEEIQIIDGTPKCSLIQIVNIKSIIRVKDSSGTETEEIVDTGIGELLSFTKTASDKTNRELQGGTYQYFMKIVFAEEKTNVDVDGKIEFVTTDKNGRTVSEFNINGEGFTDDGELILRINTSSGTFFKKISEIVKVHGNTKLEVIITELTVSADDRVFSLGSSETIYQVDFQRDQNKDIITNELGKNVIVWATDDKLTVSSSGTSNSVKKCIQYARYHGCIKYAIYTYKTLAPAMAGFDVFQDGKLIKSYDKIIGQLCLKMYNPTSLGCRIGSPNSVTVFPITLLQRDSDIRIVFDSSGGKGASKIIEFHTPTSQKNYSFNCSTKGCNF